MSVNKKSNGGRSNVGSGVLSGIITGAVLTLLYVKFGFTLPSWLQPVDKIKGFFSLTTASFFANENDLKEQQRYIAINIKENPEWYTEIDDSFGFFITEEIVWRTKVIPALKVLRTSIRGADKIVQSQKFQGQLLERLLKYPEIEVRDTELTHKYLKSRFSGLSYAQISEQLKRISLGDLLQIPSPSAKIIFALPMTSSTRIDIYNGSKQNIKTLVDSELPAGQYRLYWDYTDKDEQSLSTSTIYTYEIYVNGEQKPWRYGRLY